MQVIFWTINCKENKAAYLTIGTLRSKDASATRTSRICEKREFAFFQSLSRLFLPLALSVRRTLLKLNCKGSYQSYFQCRVIFTCVGAFGNKMEAMHERSPAKVNVEPRSTSRLSSALFILPYVR